MGGTLSTILFRPIYEEVPELRKWEEFFQSLTLDEVDIGRLYRVFKKIDKEKRGFLSVMDLIAFLKCDSTPFTERVLSIFDIDGSGIIDFKLLKTVLWPSSSTYMIRSRD